MFSKKHFILYISKHFIDPGLVTIGKNISFEGFEALAYDENTLADVLRQIRLLRKNFRVVLSDELVYVTELAFPAGTSLTRDLVRRSLESAIPEDLRLTVWDFQTLKYIKKKETETEILVQAAVMEGKFFRTFSQALQSVPLDIESIVPESYALSRLAADYSGVSLLAARGRESVLLAAVENGFVIAASVEREELTLATIEKFISFVSERKSGKAARIIFSHFTEDEMLDFQKLQTGGYELIQADYNPLVGAALQTRVSGKDEEVLNLNTFLFEKKTNWRNILKKYASFAAGVFLIFAMPASTDYKLRDFGFGTGGVSNATSGSYALDAISGEQSAGNLDGTSYDLGPGLIFTNQANVPPAPTFTNPSNYYNKLKIVLDTGSNPSDTKFAIAISTDNFVSDTRYVQSDDTVGATLGVEDYQTYANWGGASGTLIIGLVPNTTYKVKVKAWQGKFTETGYGPTATAATIGPQMTFDIDVSASDEDNSVSTIDLGSLPAGTVVDSPTKVWVNFETNGESGGRVYVYSSNAGLQSSTVSYTIDSVTDNLTSASEGFGAQKSTATNGLSPATLYDTTGNSVGIIDTTIREIFTASAPTTNGRGSFLLKAKSSNVTPAASDYSETLTVIASASF